MYIWPKPYYMQCPYKERFGSENEKELHVMSRAAFIENVAKKGFGAWSRDGVIAHSPVG